MHTPGPWMAEGERVFSETPYTQHVATTHVTGDGSRATLDANARLIAAAPNLLSALEEISARCDEATDHGHIWADTVIRIGRIVDAAIAEAKGE